MIFLFWNCVKKIKFWGVIFKRIIPNNLNNQIKHIGWRAGWEGGFWIHTCIYKKYIIYLMWNRHIEFLTIYNCMSQCVMIMPVLQFQVEGQTKTSLKEKWFFCIFNNNLMMILVLVIVHNFAKFWFKESNLIQWNASYYKLSKIFTIGHLSTEACLNMRQWGGNQLDLERRRGVGRDWVRGDSSKNRRKFESGDLFSKNQSQQLNILGKLWSQ